MNLIPFSATGMCLESYFIKITSGSRIIYWIIIGMIVTGIGILPFIYVDVSVQARGYFQSDIEKQVIYSPFQGKIVYTSVSNGTHINSGDTLLIIDSESIRAQHSALLQRIAENNASICDLEKLTSHDSLEKLPGAKSLVTLRYKAELANLRNQQAIQLQKYKKKKSEHERNTHLYSQDIIPEAEYENSLYILVTEKDNLNQILIYQESQWQNDLTFRRNEGVKLLAELQQYGEALRDRIIIAPISGEIIQSTDIQIGSITTLGQKIAEISPDGELIATCFVKPSDIGLIYDKQKIRIQVDAFNYNEWGMLQGEIVDISDDMIVENGTTAYFRIKCKPATTFLSLKNGYKASMKKGMSVNTRIVVIRRSLFNLLFDKADNWFNPYTYKPE
jgi:membrane fusion protein, peptide pheromone/bacteriocin exporter